MNLKKGQNEMNANKVWRQYNVFHKRKTQQHTPGVYKALKAQLKYYEQTRNIDGIPIEPIATELKNIYVDAGPLYAFHTYTNVMKEAGLKKEFSELYSIKGRMPIGFHATFVDAVLNFFKVDFLNTASDITETTKEFIRQSLSRGLAAGEDLEYIIRGIMGDGFTKKRAALIARTEVAKATNVGEQAGTDKTGLLTKKEWLSVRDDRTRRDHITADGQIVADGKPFDIGVEHYQMQRPGAGKGADGRRIPAKEVCNCRCCVGRHVMRDARGVIMMQGQGGATVTGPAVIVKPVFKPAASIKDARQYSKELFESAYGLKIVSISASAKMDLPKYNRYNKQLFDLTNDYNISNVYNKTAETKIKFQSGKTFYGKVKTQYNGRDLMEMNYGHETDTANSRALNLNAKFVRGKSRVDLENADVSTVVHEFGHVIGTSRQTAIGDEKIKEFWKLIAQMKDEYQTRLIGFYAGNDTVNLQRFSLGKYANTNLNEFMAEAFTEYKLSSNPSEYALKVGRLIDKFFKK